MDRVPVRVAADLLLSHLSRLSLLFVPVRVGVTIYLHLVSRYGLRLSP